MCVGGGGELGVPENFRDFPPQYSGVTWTESQYRLGPRSIFLTVNNAFSHFWWYKVFNFFQTYNSVDIVQNIFQSHGVCLFLEM